MLAEEQQTENGIHISSAHRNSEINQQGHMLRIVGLVWLLRLIIYYR